ncbi:transposase [Streptomyces sp. NBC_01594]
MGIGVRSTTSTTTGPTPPWSWPLRRSPRFEGIDNGAVTQLRADGFDAREADVARLSPFVRHHVNMLGRYSFQLPELPGGLRPLRDPDADDDR